MNKHLVAIAAVALGVAACQDGPEGLAKSQAAGVHVRLDFEARPLPEIPLPNDLATIHDPAAATGRRINASMLAATSYERRTRELVDQLDGWGTFQPITVPFDGDINLQDIVDRHHGDDFAFANDAIYLVNVTKGHAEFGKPAPLDIGNGNFPVVVEQIAGYWKADPRGDTNNILFEEHDEDQNGNGKLDPGEDTDLDGLLDKPNYKPGVTKKHSEMNLAERADALLTWWERETRTLVLRPLIPLRERTTYAVVLTHRLRGSDGKPVGSPFPTVNHVAQTQALLPLKEALAAHAGVYGGLTVDQIGFAWTFTTGSIEAGLKAARDGLYGKGAQKHLAAAYPPDVEKLLPLYDSKPAKSYENTYAVSGETFTTVATLVAASGLAGSTSGEQGKRYLDALKYVDYHMLGTYKSPQLFQLKGKDGKFLGYNDMSWPADVHGNKVDDRPESVTFWLTTPRKEATADGKPRGIVILGHGYTGSKTEVFGFHQFFARMGLAVIAIDNVSHGFTLGKKDRDTLNGIFGGMGLSPLITALTTNRSRDQDTDGEEDSGADFWTSYTFHTRDVVRQTALDYVQLIRVIRGWDGKRLWAQDVNGNGKADDIAGDVDGDGKVDVGGPDMPLHMLGGSLGGIMSAVVGGIEPELSATVPIAGGGGLIDVGIRSIQGGVREAVVLRLMGPLYIAAPDGAAHTLAIQAVIPSLNDTAKVTVATLDGKQLAQLKPGDSVRGDNLDNGEYDCARLAVDQDCKKGCEANAAVADKATCPNRCLTFRLGLASDIATPAQRHQLRFFQGDAFEVGVRDEVKHRACKVKADAKAAIVVDKFGNDVKFHAKSDPLWFKAGEPLSPLAEGLGLHRARPELRRFMGFAQMVLDPADPAVYARHFADPDIQNHALVLNTVGDMNVPVSTGAAIGRAAGLLDWAKKVAQWGDRTVNQALVDTYVLEAVDKIPRFVDPAGNGVLFDPEDLSGSANAANSTLPAQGTKFAPTGPAARGKDGFHAYRLSPPLHTHAVVKDSFGGFSGTFFPYVEPGGKHGFWEPGAHVDFLKKQCKADAKAAGTDESACDGKAYFDHGTMIMYAIGRYLGSGGTQWAIEPCMNDGSCPEVMPAPKARP
ncbi:MAG: hypothetical protein FJ100_12250 [Deltaproteobacteria bacterium]|nr:hypothetical protein [Deltaproteobacteria bacterium]